MARRNSQCACQHDSEVSTDCCATDRSAWWMLLSHHPPCDLDRTWVVFGVNVCVRCLGMGLAFIVTVIMSSILSVAYGPWIMVLCLSAMAPAGIDFSLGELFAAYPRSNLLRFVTGVVFGAGGGVCVYWLFSKGRILPVVLFLCLAVLMQFVIALAFRVGGHLEEYVAKYEDAVWHGGRCPLPNDKIENHGTSQRISWEQSGRVRICGDRPRETLVKYL